MAFWFAWSCGLFFRAVGRYFSPGMMPFGSFGSVHYAPASDRLLPSEGLFYPAVLRRLLERRFQAPRPDSTRAPGNLAPRGQFLRRVETVPKHPKAGNSCTCSHGAG